MKVAYTIIFYLTIFISPLIVIILHELGHAFFALLFTKDDVTVFLGSHGNRNENYSFKIGRLKMYFNLKIFEWRAGLCYSSNIENPYKRAIQILAGPLVPFIIACIILKTAFLNDSGYSITTAMIFMLFTILSMVYNLIPRTKPIELADGTQTYNDGYRLVELFKYRAFYSEYTKAIALYNQKKYNDAADIFIKIIAKGFENNQIYRLVISSCVLDKKFSLLQPHIERYVQNFKPTADDFINIGYYYNQTGDSNKAMEYYNKSLDIKENWNALNNIGYSLLIEEKYTEALHYLDRAVGLDSTKAYGYNNRGLAKIKLKQEIDGLQDLEAGKKIDPNNSFYFKNMGIYHFDKHEYEKALELFEKAKEMDDSTYKIDEDIQAARLRLQ